jgi:hypothetical protein
MGPGKRRDILEAVDGWNQIRRKNEERRVLGERTAESGSSARPLGSHGLK